MATADDINGLKAQVAALTERVAALEAKPSASAAAPPTTADSVLAAVDLLETRQRKELWRKLRDGR